MSRAKQVFGIVPAAGAGSRLWPYRAPKELIQVGYHHSVTDGQSPRMLPRAAVEYVLGAMRRGGIGHVMIVVSPTKWEICNYLGDGRHLGVDLAYLCQENPCGMPQAIELARPFVTDHTVCLGMPDTIIAPDDCYAQLLDFHYRQNADLSLGVFPTSEPRELAPVLIEQGTGRVLTISDKPAEPPAENTWGIAAWGPAFTELLHDMQSAPRGQKPAELALSEVFMAAITAGQRVCGLAFPDGEYYDIGTPAGIVRTRALLERRIVC